MPIETKFWLYGTSAGKTKKTLKRIADDAFAKAKAFHIFIKKSPRSKWMRITDELQEIPGFIRAKADKELYIQSMAESIAEALTPKPKPKPKPTPKPKPKKEIELPDLPSEPRVTLTKNQFKAQMSRILYDELDLDNLKWSENRIDSFINKMWNSFRHAPHLIASEQFRRSLVTKELKRIKDKKLRKKAGEMEEAFRKELEKREVSLDPGEVSGEVKVQFKEAFNAERMKSPNDMDITMIENGLLVEKPRQKAFAQVNVEYDKLMSIGKESLLANDSIVNIALAKTRSDMEKLFDQSIDKGLFKYGEVPEFSFRLLVPLVDGKGEIPADYLAKKGKRRTGFGYGTAREKIKNKKDFKKILDDLFSNVKVALAKYIKLNRSSGFMIAGFTIERLLQ